MREFAALLGALVLVLAVSARTVAAPFAYVSNFGDNRVSVIDTATNPPTVVATVPAGIGPHGVAVTPDGKHVYVRI
jgi:YVTN family beta-propeller protein